MSLVKIQGNASGTGTLTIAAQNTNSNNTLTIPNTTGNIITSGDSGTVSQTMLATGVAGTGPAFSAYRSGSQQSITGGVYTRVNCQTEQFDTANCYDNTTNYRFTPNVAGYYQFNASLDVGAPNNRYTAYLYKNGTVLLAGPNQIGNGTNSQAANFSGIAYANGTTDYFELYVQGNNNCSIDNGSNPINSWFQGYMVRSA